VATVRFMGQDLEVEVPVGTTLLAAAARAHAPLGSACGGVCACSTCHLYVEAGGHLLTPAADDEEDRLDGAFDVRMNSRLGCQARIERDGLVVVRISRESLETYDAEHPKPPGAG
jgi:ferredoxin, 2Fe-2S